MSAMVLSVLCIRHGIFVRILLRKIRLTLRHFMSHFPVQIGIEIRVQTVTSTRTKKNVIHSGQKVQRKFLARKFKLHFSPTCEKYLETFLFCPKVEIIVARFARTNSKFPKKILREKINYIYFFLKNQNFKIVWEIFNLSKS